MEKPVYVVRSRADLDALGPYSRAGRRLRFREIRLELPQLQQAELVARSARLNRAYFACGCGEAVLAGILTLVTLAIMAALRPGGWQALAWIDLGYAVAAFFVASGVGKWIGLQRAHLALRRELGELRQYVKRALDDKLPRIPCGVR